MHGAPICHSLDYFSNSPLQLDFDRDFFGVQKADLIYHGESTFIGRIADHRVYEIKYFTQRKQERT